MQNNRRECDLIANLSIHKWPYPFEHQMRGHRLRGQTQPAFPPLAGKHGRHFPCGDTSGLVQCYLPHLDNVVRFRTFEWLRPPAQ